jgi:hypothetical protein
MSMSRLDIAAKFGARNSVSDAGRLQQIHDLAVENGAQCGEAGKGLNLSYAKSIGANTLPDLAVKRTAPDEIKGYLVLWGDPDRVDLDKEFFTKDTDFWDVPLKGFRPPLTYDHAQDDATKTSPVVGAVSEFGDDEMGRWYVAQLDKSYRYRKAIDAMIEAGQLGTSSDSAPQYVLREKRGKGVWLKRWPMLAAALTPAPCEPRQLATVEYAKGFTLPDTLTDWEWQVARSKRLRF